MLLQMHKIRHHSPHGIGQGAHAQVYRLSPQSLDAAFSSASQVGHVLSVQDSRAPEQAHGLAVCRSARHNSHNIWNKEAHKPTPASNQKKRAKQRPRPGIQ